MTALAADFPNALPPLRWPAGTRHALVLCAVASLALHLVFAIVARPAADAAPRQAAHAAGASSKVQLRLITPPPAPATQAAAPAGPAVVQSALVPMSRAQAPAGHVVPTSPSVDLAPNEAPRAAPEASASATDSTTPTTPPAEASALPWSATSADPTGFDDYIPRPLLSVGPAATAPVLLDTPTGDFGVARHVGILSLYIDEEGAVRHVAGSEPLLPALLEQAAREAFMAARFTPGEVDGRPVKSRIRVEVVFDNTPLK